MKFFWGALGAQRGDVHLLPLQKPGTDIFQYYQEQYKLQWGSQVGFKNITDIVQGAKDSPGVSPFPSPTWMSKELLSPHRAGAQLWATYE